MADALTLIGVVAILGTVAIVARRFSESQRPTVASDWSESDFGDAPHLNDLFHNGTINR